jgi:hypothetical protein
VVEDLLVVGVGDFVVFERRGHVCGVGVGFGFGFGFGFGIGVGFGLLVSQGTVTVLVV